MINKHLDGLEMFLGVFEAWVSIEPLRAIVAFLRKAPDRPVVGHWCIRSLTALHYPLAF